MTTKFVAFAVLLIQGISAQLMGNLYGPIAASNLATEAALAGAFGPGMNYPGNMANMYGPGMVGPNLPAEAALAGLGPGMSYPGNIGNMYGPGMVGPNLAAEAALAGAIGSGIPYPAAAVYEAAPVLHCGFGLTLADLAANCKGFSVTSTSPFAPSGISVLSEDLLFEGPLAVSGTMPFLGSVSLEGPLPATGQGEVSYGCGNGNIGIISEEFPSPLAANYPGPGPMAYDGYGPRQAYGPMY